MIAKWFDHIANRCVELSGHWSAFMASIAIIIGWAVSGPFLKFSETWQLTINTGTTIITFLMVFLIQHTQNRNDHAIHAKLDEIIRAIPSANNDLRGIEESGDETP